MRQRRDGERDLCERNAMCKMSLWQCIKDIAKALVCKHPFDMSIVWLFHSVCLSLSVLFILPFWKFTIFNPLSSRAHANVRLSFHFFTFACIHTWRGDIESWGKLKGILFMSCIQFSSSFFLYMHIYVQLQCRKKCCCGNLLCVAFMFPHFFLSLSLTAQCKKKEVVLWL